MGSQHNTKQNIYLPSMKKKRKIKINPNKANRDSAVEQGFYDGRFRNKVIPDKKKKYNKEGDKNYKISTNE